MSPFRILCFILLICPTWTIFLPEFDMQSLKPAVLHTLTCPAFIPERPNFSYDQRNSQDVILFKPKPDFDKQVEGLMCTKVELTTTSEDFVLSSCRIIRSHRERPINKAECDLAMAQYLRGDELDTSYPDPDCSGYSLHKKTKTFVNVKPHAVKFDPYTMTYIDSLFAGGKTIHTYSSTVHESTLWKMTGNTPPCSKFEEIKGELMFATNAINSRGANIHLWALGIQEQTFADVCKIKFCGLTGVLFPNGEWFNIRDSNNGGNTSVVTERLEACPDSVVIKSESTDQEILHSFTTSYQTSMRLWCLDTHEDLNSGIPIPHYRLSYLIPNAVGIGSVYKMVNKTLMTTIGHYRNVQLNKLTQLNVLGTDDKGSDFIIPPDQLTVSASDGSVEWVNGLIYHDGRWSVPIVDILRNNIHHLLSRPLKLKSIQHTIAEHVLSAPQLEDGREVTMHQTLETGQKGGWITSYIHQITTRTSMVIWTLGGVGILVVLLFLIRVAIWSKIFSLCTRKKKTQLSSETQERGLVHYHVSSDSVDLNQSHDTPRRVVWA